jgi:hypothetical protein
MNVKKADVWSECLKAENKAQAEEVLGRLSKAGVSRSKVKDFLREGSDRLNAGTLIRVWEAFDLQEYRVKEKRE